MSRARAKETTRQRLLDAGVRLLEAHPVGDVTGQIRAHDIAPLAGLSTGAFYYHWDSQADYVEDLLDHLLSKQRFESVQQRTRETMRAAMETAQPIEEVFRVTANENFRHLLQDRWFVFHLALWTGAVTATDERLRSRLAQFYRDLNGTYVPLFERMLEAYGLQMCDGCSVIQLSAALSSLAEGLVIRALVDPESVPNIDPEWTLLAHLSVGVLHRLTEPIPAA